MINHNREIKYFIDTIGISLEREVMNIQDKLKKMAKVIGCFKNRLSKFQSKNNFITNKRSTPAINGSVGKDTPKPKPESFMVTDKGVRKTIIQINLSRAKKYNSRKKIPNGNIKATY